MSATKHTMSSQPQHIWLASYPRSGNTLLRTILFQCFDAPSSSIYEEDLGGTTLAGLAGNVSHDKDGNLIFPAGKTPLIKTHELPPDDAPAIYILRDGREATASLYKFYNKGIALADIINGNHRFGTWSAHIEAWSPLTRANTLLITYEDMLTDRLSVINNISEFLHLPMLTDKIPTRKEMAAAGSKWVNKKTNWRATLAGQSLKSFMAINRPKMKEFYN